MQKLWENAVACAIAVLALCLAASKPSANELPPLVSPPEGFSFHLPAVHRLPNGLRVVLIECHDVPIVRLYAIVQVGAEADPPRLSGLAGMVAACFPKAQNTGAHIGSPKRLIRPGDQLIPAQGGTSPMPM